MMPATIHQVGARPSDANPSWRLHNPNFTHTFLTDADCGVLAGEVEIPTARSAYELVLQGAQRADLCRLMAIFERGGIYVDTDVVAYGPIARAIPERATFFVSEWGSFEFFGAVPRHPFVEGALRHAPGNVLAEIKKCRLGVCCRGAHQCIIETTGPRPFFNSLVAAGRAYNCSNRRWIPQNCSASASSVVRGYFKCNDTGTRSPYRTTMCGILRHADCRNSGIGKACGKSHYSHARSFFNYSGL